MSKLNDSCFKSYRKFKVWTSIPKSKDGSNDLIEIPPAIIPLPEEIPPIEVDIYTFIEELPDSNHKIPTVNTNAKIKFSMTRKVIEADLTRILKLRLKAIRQKITPKVQKEIDIINLKAEKLINKLRMYNINKLIY